MDGRSWEAKIIPVSHSHNLYFPSNIPFSNFGEQWNQHLLTVETNQCTAVAGFLFSCQKIFPTNVFLLRADHSHSDSDSSPFRKMFQGSAPAFWRWTRSLMETWPMPSQLPPSSPPFKPALLHLLPLPSVPACLPLFLLLTSSTPHVVGVTLGQDR